MPTKSELSAENAELRAQNTFLLALIQDLAEDALSRPAYVPVGFQWRRLTGNGRGFEWTDWWYAKSRHLIPKDRSGIQVQTLFVQSDPDA